MINYADYDFYMNEYHGSLSNSLFTSLIGKASREIDKYINREIKEAELDEFEKVKWVACELVDFLNVNNNIDNNYSSISIDGVSKTKRSNLEIKVNKLNIINGLPQELTRCL